MERLIPNSRQIWTPLIPRVSKSSQDKPNPAPLHPGRTQPPTSRSWALDLTRSSLLLSCLFLFACASGTSPSGSGNMGPHPTPAERKAQIASEPTGSFYYGRRYSVHKTRFWGYLRKPRQPWSQAKLVIINEDKKSQPDRYPEYGDGKRFGFDQNYEYRMEGRYTGRTLYEPNSNQFLPEFQLTDYQLLNTNPGWLFSPADRYNPIAITLRP